MALISYIRVVLYENISGTKILRMWEIRNCMLCCYLYAALLSVHEQTHVYVRQALNRSINMCYASKLKKFHMRKLFMVDIFSTNKFLYNKSRTKIFSR